MRERHTLITALIIVVLAGLAAALLLLVALVVWLAEQFGSIVAPCLVLGVSMALLAIVVYKVSLRDAIREVNERMGVIYDVTKAVREVVMWGIALLGKRNE